MRSTYKERRARKAARLAERSGELDSLHAQATGLLGDPAEGLILGQLGAARQALVGYLPTVRAEIAEAEAVGAAGEAYIARTYGGHGAREGGDR